MRISRLQYFMKIADIVAQRSTCSRAKVGAVLVDPVSNKIVATGYNGSVPGAPHCEDVGCMMEDGHCRRTVHAELNSILHLEHSYTMLDLYTTYQPCYQCTKALITANVKRVYYREPYEDHIRDMIIEEARTPMMRRIV